MTIDTTVFCAIPFIYIVCSGFFQKPECAHAAVPPFHGTLPGLHFRPERRRKTPGLREGPDSGGVRLPAGAGHPGKFPHADDG